MAAPAGAGAASGANAPDWRRTRGVPLAAKFGRVPGPRTSPPRSPGSVLAAFGRGTVPAAAPVVLTGTISDVATNATAPTTVARDKDASRRRARLIESDPTWLPLRSCAAGGAGCRLFSGRGGFQSLF